MSDLRSARSGNSTRTPRLRRAAWKSIAIFLIAVASAIAELHGGRRLRAVTPFLAGAAMALTAAGGRSRGDGSAPEQMGRFNATLWSVGIIIAAWLYVAPRHPEPRALLVALLPLSLAAVAEEIVFRDELFSALLRPAGTPGPPRGSRYLKALVASQLAFAAVHIPTVALAWWWNGGSLAGLLTLVGAFAFGSLMVVIRQVGAGWRLRAVYHTVINVVALVDPRPAADSWSRLLGCTVALLMLLAAVTWTSDLATFRRKTSAPQVPRL